MSDAASPGDEAVTLHDVDGGVTRRAVNERGRSRPVDQAVTRRPGDDADRKYVRDLLDRPAVRRKLGDIDADRLLEPGNADASPGGGVESFVVRAGGDRVGTVGLLGIRPAFGTAEVGYAVEPASRGNGYATAALRTAADRAFTDLGLYKLHGFVLAGNDASRRVLEKAGFEREETRSDEGVLDGGVVDLHRYGLAARDW